MGVKKKDSFGVWSIYEGGGSAMDRSQGLRPPTQNDEYARREDHPARPMLFAVKRDGDLVWADRDDLTSSEVNRFRGFGALSVEGQDYIIVEGQRFLLAPIRNLSGVDQFGEQLARALNECVPDSGTTSRRHLTPSVVEEAFDEAGLEVRVASDKARERQNLLVRLEETGDEAFVEWDDIMKTWSVA